MTIKDMYKQRTKHTLKGLAFLLLLPFPGLAIENFVLAKKIDNQIKREVIQDELTVVCPLHDTKK